MLKNKCFLVLAALFLFGSPESGKSQNNNIAINLNEISVGNNSYPDNYGTHDAVEIYNAHTASVSLQSYYLSNDRNNLYKWQFPTTFTMASGGYAMVYLSGINESKFQGGQWYHHASFTIDQCKNQWLILTTSAGVVRDSVFIRKTQIGHTWGRVNYNVMGVTAWRLYPAHSFPLQNPVAGSFAGYMPTPTFSPQAGWGQNAQILTINVNGQDADTLNSCNEVHFTMDGSYPTLSSPTYSGALNGPPVITDNQIFRAVNYQRSVFQATNNCLQDVYLPSFCETNTYFSNSSGEYDSFSSDFGVMSVAIHTTDTSWMTPPNNAPPPTTVHVEYFDKKQQILEGYATMTKPPQEAWLTNQRGFYLTIDDRMGYGCNFEGNIFNVAGLGTTDRKVFPTLHVYGGDIESHSAPAGSSGTTAVSFATGIRDVFLQSLAAKYDIKVNPLHIKPLILFVNGVYWGAYDLREVYDKYYETYYNGRPGQKDSLNLSYYSFGTDNNIVNYQVDGSTSSSQPTDFRTNVYNPATTPGFMANKTNYDKLMSHLDQQSFMDYMILNSYAMNSNLYSNNVAFARNTTYTASSKWHYYLWNVPATFTFQALSTSPLAYNNTSMSPCFVQTNYTPTAISAGAGNGHGNILYRLMNTIDATGLAAGKFQLDYKNRYQDLLNTALKCENILAHYDYVVNLFAKEMRYHEDLASTPKPGRFATNSLFNWDTNCVHLRKAIAGRCNYFSKAFNTTGCYTMQGPNDLTVDVYPPGAGSVKLNSIILPFYVWSGRYYNTQMGLKAIPTTTNYVFHHWEFKNGTSVKNNRPLSLDSVAIDFYKQEDVLAVFTDITNDIDLPTGFTPNGDGSNDEFKPLGSALYSREYDFRIWNRWGQEVFRSTDPAHGWDGNFEGKPAQTGVFAYVITYKNVFNESKIKKGNVTLIR